MRSRRSIFIELNDYINSDSKQIIMDHYEYLIFHIHTSKEKKESTSYITEEESRIATLTTTAIILFTSF